MRVLSKLSVFQRSLNALVYKRCPLKPFSRCKKFSSLKQLSVSPADFALLKKRGPDSFKTLELNLENNKGGLFAASVLSLRAGLDKSTQQPLHEPSSGNVLLWNGELFASDLISVGPDENDGQNIFKLLCQETLAEPFNESLIFRVFESIKGLLRSRCYFAIPCLILTFKRSICITVLSEKNKYDLFWP